MKKLLAIRFCHWVSGFIVHVIISISALAIAIKDWNKDCEGENELQITGSGWLITCEVVLLLYSLFLLPGFLLWDLKKRSAPLIALDVYIGLVIVFFSIFLIGWNLFGVFLLFEEIEDCRGSDLWIMSVITLVRNWFSFFCPLSVVIVRQIENCWK